MNLRPVLGGAIAVAVTALVLALCQPEPADVPPPCPTSTTALLGTESCVLSASSTTAPPISSGPFPQPHTSVDEGQQCPPVVGPDGQCGG